MKIISRGTVIEFDYVNWRGVSGHRKAEVMSTFYGSTEHHPEEQWLLKGYDMNKDAVRIFGMRDMSNVIY